MIRSKRQFTLWVQPSTFKMIDDHYKADNCISKSDFVEKAIIKYCGIIDSDRNTDFLNQEITKTLKGMIDEAANKISRNLFKIAVDQSVLARFFATHAACASEENIKRIRKECIDDVKRTNGCINLEAAGKKEHGGAE